MARHPRRAERCGCRGDAGEVGREVRMEGSGTSREEGGGEGRQAAQEGGSEGGREQEDGRQEAESRTGHRATGLEGEEDPGAMKRVLRDVQFWIPVLVLIGGLLVLRWIR